MMGLGFFFLSESWNLGRNKHYEMKAKVFNYIENFTELLHIHFCDSEYV